ncbi:MAG TPA: hypothetical protein VEC56_10940 [Candidatus Krumholzibacteria bacterium]|nr:hypothetical protein [Candidatus Krumholzibacteria bacterium]
MESRLRILVLALVTAAALGPAPAAAAKKAPPGDVASQSGSSDKGEPSQGEVREAAGPMDVFADIERGWKAGQVDPILRHFGSQKVAISIQGTGPSGGTFSRNQSYYLLKDLFRYTLTKKFEFVQYRKPNEDGNETFAVAERHYQRNDDSQLVKDKVYVSLHLERDGKTERWVVDEIKSIR